MLLANRVALVTGGAKGMGKGMALKFSEEGAIVAIADINLQEAENTISEVVRQGGQGLGIQCDVTNSSQVKETVAKVIAKYNKLDILVNNAGGVAPAPPIEDMPEELWDKVINLNLKSDFLFSKYAVPYMKAQKYGKIINISSIGAVLPPAHAIHYNSAKSGVLGFTYDLAFALAPFNINVNAILPGPIRTDFYAERLKQVPDAEAFFAGMGKRVPLQRVGMPQDIANAALFLASELSSYITGTTLLVSGGLPLQANVAPPSK